MRPEYPGHETPPDGSPSGSPFPAGYHTTATTDQVSPAPAFPRRRALRGEHPSGPLSLPSDDTVHATAAGRQSDTLLPDDMPTMSIPTRAEARRRERAVTAAPQASGQRGPGRGRSGILSSRKVRRGLTLTALAGSLAVIVPVLDGTVTGAHGAVSGTFSLSPGQSRSADSGQSFLNGSGSVSFTVPQVPTGGGIYLGVEARAKGNATSYRAKVRVLADSTMRVGLSKVISGREAAIGSVPIPGKVGPDSVVHVQIGVTGSGAPQLSARGWMDDAPAPEWQYSAPDAYAPSIADKGTVKAWSYLSRAGTAMSVTFSDLTARPDDTPAPPVTTEPSATPTATPTVTPTATPTATNSAPVTPSPSVSSPPATTEPQPSSWPGANTTGVPAGKKLRRHDGNLVITKAGATYDSLDIHGFVDVRAPNVTIKRSIIRGGVATYNRGLITNTTSSAKNLVVEDSALIAAHPSVWIDGVKGGNFTLRRVNIAGGVVDGVKVHGNNVVVQDSWIHGLRYYSHDPNQGGGPTHNDGVQVLGGTNITVKHNTITVPSSHNAVMQVTQDYAATKSLSFKQNWVDGGTCSVKLSHTGGNGSLGPVSVTNNHFGTGTEIKKCAVLRTSSTSLTSSGNVWADTGKTVIPIVYG